MNTIFHKINKPQSIIFLFLAIVIITVIRNSLELIGYYTGSDNFCCFLPHYSSFLNTFAYLWLILCGVWLMHWILKGSAEQFNKLLWQATWLLAIIFILVPIINNLLSYHGPMWPIWYRAPWLLFNLYLPAGIIFGLMSVLVLGPILIKKIYPTISTKRSIATVSFVFILVFFWTYQVGLYITYDVLAPAITAQGIDLRSALPLDAYSAVFLLPVLFLFPFFIKSYLSYQRPAAGKISYLIFWLIFAGLILKILYFLK